MPLASAVTVSVVAIALAAASFAVSVWQAIMRWWELRDKQKARIAVDRGEICVEPDYWEVELWITNVGLSHARRVHVWLEDDDGAKVCEEYRLLRPLMSGEKSERVRLRVPRHGQSGFLVAPVRSWWDSREEEVARDVSAQRIALPSS